MNPSSTKHGWGVATLLLEAIAITTTLGPLIASAGAVAAVAAFADQLGPWPWYAWVTVSPLLYFCWLVVFLSISAWLCGQVGTRNPKPRHAIVGRELGPGSSEFRGLMTATMCYRRFAIVQSIPFVPVLMQFRRLNRLVLRSYSPSVHIGRSATNWAAIYDPDLTEVGDDVLLGGRSTISGHSMTVRSDGAWVYASAPVTIGDRTTIGADARVPLGCVIGHDAVIKHGSVLEPFTHVPPGEVWGGNPARFVRNRNELPSAGSAPAGLTSWDGEHPGAPTRADIRQLVVQALGLEAGETADDLSTETCPLWDSVGQITIAASIYDRYGIAVDGADVFRLTSLDDILGLVAAAEPGEDPAARAAVNALPDDVEMLPLVDAQIATRALALSLGGPPEGAAPLQLHIAASFTAQAIEPPLRLWAWAFGFDLECRFADYDQIVQTLLDRTGSIATSASGITVVLVRPEDLPPDMLAATAALDQILEAIERAASAGPPPHRLLVGTLPPVVSSFGAIDRQETDVLRHRWRTRLAATAGVELFDFSQVVERVGIENARGSRLEALARSGYSQRLHQELAIALVRRIRAGYGRSAKVVALDCDNTLWGGVVGEVGVAGITVGPDGPGRSFQLFQQYLKRLQERGLLLVVVSRNEAADVHDVFTRHPEMVLRGDDIAGWRVNWRHKSENLRELAEELNLGLDSFVLLDDDAVSRMEVKSRTPEVHVVPLPADAAAFCETLDRLWLFDAAPATAVDATRTEKARQEAQRRRERTGAISLDDFLGRLELAVEVREAEDADVARVAQLTQRTNQFNLSLKRRTPDELRALTAEGKVLVLAARDRFGDYGQVGVCVLGAGEQPGAHELDTLLMSCRALGRGIEDAFLHTIARAAADAGATTLVAPFRPGPRNAQVREFLTRSGFVEVEPDRWTLPLTAAPPAPPHVRLGELLPAAVPATG